MKKNLIYLFNILLSFFVIFLIYFSINFFMKNFFSIQKYQNIIQFLLELNFLGYFYVILFESFIFIFAFPTTPLLVVNKILFQEYNITLSLLIMVCSSTSIYFVFNKIKILNLLGKKLIKKKKLNSHQIKVTFIFLSQGYFYLFIFTVYYQVL